MASPYSICASCLRSLGSAARASRAKSTRQTYTSARSYVTPSMATTRSTLYLDFLAPSATRAVGKSSSLTGRPTALLRTHTTRRSLATATATVDPSLPTQAQAILNPRVDADGNPRLISISPRASNRLHKIAESDKNPNLALRVSVESGGCHGFQYLMELTDLGEKPASDEDTVFEGKQGEKVVIDEPSLELLSGSTVDYTMELIGSQFKVTGIPGATSSCGCGSSFDIQL